MIIRIFTASVLAKPLNNAQMCGSFFVYPKSVIRVFLCHTVKRIPLIFPYRQE